MARSRSDSYEGRIGLLLLIVLSAVMLFTQRDAAIERRTTPLLTSDIQAPIAALLGKPFRSLENAVADIEDGRRALQENKALRSELTALRAETDRLRAMQGRQYRLESLLSVERNGDIPDRRIAARAVSDPSSPFVRSLLIGAGREAGIEDGYAVLSDTGLIGHVVSAGRRSARVLRLDDLNSRVAVMSVRTGARAILAGGNTNYPTLAFAVDSTQWQAGDRVVTSGDDGRLPQGLPVGKVLSEDQLRVELDFLDKPIDWVFMLPFDRIADAQDVDMSSNTETSTEEAG